MAYSILERQAPNYYKTNNIQFFFCHKGELEFADRADFGIEWGTVPALTLVDTNGRFFPFPEDTPFDDAYEFEKILSQFLLDYNKGLLRPAVNQKK